MKKTFIECSLCHVTILGTLQAVLEILIKTVQGTIIPIFIWEIEIQGN